MLLEPCVCFHIFIHVRVTKWPPIGKLLLTRVTICFLSIRTYSCQFSFSHLDFWSGNFFLIGLFPYHCLLVPFFTSLSIDTTSSFTDIVLHNDIDICRQKEENPM